MKNHPSGSPSGIRSDLTNAFCGFFMGGADIIPGVSGGTVALILGIYERLVTAISHVDGHLYSLLRQKHWSEALNYLDVRFLLALGFGIVAGILSFAGLMHHLLLHHHHWTTTVFFGLIAASSWLVVKTIGHWKLGEIVGLVCGALFAFWLVGLPIFTSPPDHLSYIFFCGLIAICAMILPGISGAFILLLLGKYAEITGLIKGLIHGAINGEILLTILTFTLGCVIGLLGFSKFLRYLLTKQESLTMAVLGGFMIGSLRKLWPFQQDLTPDVTELKHKVYVNLPLQEVSFLQEVLPTLLVVMLTMVAVIWLERLAAGAHQVESLEELLPEETDEDAVKDAAS